MAATMDGRGAGTAVRERYAEGATRVAPLDEAEPFDCSGTRLRHPRETKGEEYRVTTEADAAACGPEGCC